MICHYAETTRPERLYPLCFWTLLSSRLLLLEEERAAAAAGHAQKIVVLCRNQRLPLALFSAAVIKKIPPLSSPVCALKKKLKSIPWQKSGCSVIYQKI